jgi:hypothetical protein
MSSPNIFQVIKLRRMRWARHVALMGERRGVNGFLVGNLREGDRWGHPGVDGKMKLRWIFRM